MCEYVFNIIDAEIGLVKNGQVTLSEGLSQSFLLDRSVTGLAVRLHVRCYDENATAVAQKSLVLYKNDANKARNKALRKCDERTTDDGPMAVALRANDKLVEAVHKMHLKEYEDACERLSRSIVGKLDIEYEMTMTDPYDRYDGEYITLVVPIDPNDLEVDTCYRLSVVNSDELPRAYDLDPYLFFYHSDKPAKKIFLPYSASLRVCPFIRGELCFDKARRYRNYNDFYGDVHYDNVCMEVEVNPALVCFDVIVKEALWKDYMPAFTIKLMASNGNRIHNGTTRALPYDRHQVVVSAFTGENVHEACKDGLVTACLEVFGQEIARFVFCTKRTEPGEHFFMSSARKGKKSQTDDRKRTK